MILQPVRCSIVADGHDRWWNGVTAKIRAAVSAEFEERLRAASVFRRLRVRLQIEGEIVRRLEDVKPPSPESLF